ncbi:hypothetical protein [Paenibacillus piscarius]|uniref:hypothetical protein n=1 Tax=Paenibacillus piscarius TaxID=1089681 RepID=UPI001EE97EEB|nr:hypothetical protein [Paenibacillus piscarius]
MKQITFQEMKQIDKEVITAENFHSITSKRFYPPSEQDESSIKLMILNSIGIQAALAHKYFCQRNFKSTHSTNGQIVLFSADIDEAGNGLAMIFDKVFISLREDGRPMNVQVSEPNALALQAFSKLSADNRINPVIRHFYHDRTFVQDFTHKAYFEIEPDHRESEPNDFYNYLLQGSLIPSYVNPLSIDVSGLTMEEIEQDDLIRQLAAQVKNLYFVIYESGDPEYPIFGKNLTRYI